MMPNHSESVSGPSGLGIDQGVQGSCGALHQDQAHGLHGLQWVWPLLTHSCLDCHPGRDPAQKPLKIWAVWAVFQQDLSGLSGLSGLGGFFGKTAQTAQNLLRKPLKNRSFLAVIFERFLKQDLSGFWAVFERSSRVEVPDSCPYFRDKTLACPDFPDQN